MTEPSAAVPAPGWLPELPDEADREALIALDAAGFPAGRDEDFAAYRARLERLRKVNIDFEAELAAAAEVEVYGVKVGRETRVPDELIAESAEVTEPLYGFGVKGFPGFFLSRDIGLLWGGCLIGDTEIPLSIFLVRDAFRKRRRFLVYDRRELIAHELCHFARQELRDYEMEEFFAYQTSPSRFRRYIGNCFVKQYDALFFTLPTLLLAVMVMLQSFWLPQLPVWPFWLLVPVWPGYLLWRNARGRRKLFAAARKLLEFGVDRPSAVLFRMTGEERDALRTMNSREEFERYVDGMAVKLVRYQLIRWRFL